MLNENDQIELLRIDDAITPTDSLRVVDEGDTLEIQIVPETEDMYFYIPLDEDGATKVRDTISDWLKKKEYERLKAAIPTERVLWTVQKWVDGAWVGICEYPHKYDAVNYLMKYADDKPYRILKVTSAYEHAEALEDGQFV